MIRRRPRRSARRPRRRPRRARACATFDNNDAAADGRRASEVSRDDYEAMLGAVRRRRRELQRHGRSGRPARWPATAAGACSTAMVAGHRQRAVPRRRRRGDHRRRPRAPCSTSVARGRPRARRCPTTSSQLFVDLQAGTDGTGRVAAPDAAELERLLRRLARERSARSAPGTSSSTRRARPTTSSPSSTPAPTSPSWPPSARPIRRPAETGGAARRRLRAADVARPGRPGVPGRPSRRSEVGVPTSARSRRRSGGTSSSAGPFDESPSRWRRCSPSRPAS